MARELPNENCQISRQGVLWGLPKPSFSLKSFQFYWKTEDKHSLGILNSSVPIGASGINFYHRL